MTRVFAVDSLARSCAVSTPNAETCFLRSTTDHSKTALLAHAVAAINIIRACFLRSPATLTRLHRSSNNIICSQRRMQSFVSCVSTTTGKTASIVKYYFAVNAECRSPSKHSCCKPVKLELTSAISSRAWCSWRQHCVQLSNTSVFPPGCLVRRGNAADP
jgi:hypothetical protein